MNDWPLTVFYDGACPFCRDEMQRLKHWDKQQRLLFVNINAPGFNPADYGLALQNLLQLLHVQTAAGRLYIGMPAVRVIYAAVGKGWIFRASQLPVLRPMSDYFYAGFARRRLLWSRLLSRKSCTDNTCTLL